MTVNRELGARCKINFQPQGPDIDAYGPRPAGLLGSERVGNAASEANYLRLGFEPIGEKDISWGAGAVGGRISQVVLYGRSLGEVTA